MIATGKTNSRTFCRGELEGVEKVAVTQNESFRLNLHSCLCQCWLDRLEKTCFLQTKHKTRLGVDKVKPKGWFKFLFDRQVVGTILKLSYFLNFFVGHLLHG